MTFNAATFWEEVEQTLAASRDRMLKPEGCTCSPPARAVETMPGHGEYELLVDSSCRAHEELMKHGSRK